MVSSLPVSSVRMEKEQSHMTEKMLNLTLEIIYLLTGEHYIAFKLYDGYVSPNIKNNPSPFTLQLPSRIHEKTNDKNIVEVTQKMIELLTGEVPTTHQETMVEQQELYRDTMENQPHTSLDGSSNRNPPERCPLPLYSQESTQGDQDNCQDNKGDGHVIIKVEDKEDPCVGGNEPYMGGDELHKEEEIAVEISTDGLYSQFSMKTRPATSPHEEVDDSTEDPITDLHPSPHSADLCDPPIYGSSLSDPSPSITFHTGYGTTKKFTCSNCGKFFTQITTLLAHKRTHAGDTTHSCPTCGKHFPLKKDLISHLAHHTSDQTYSCSYCRKHFTSKSRLDRHEIIHSGYKPYSCTMCGKRFTQKANLARHERTHTGEKPFSCLECGKSFTRKATLIEHQYSHK